MKSKPKKVKKIVDPRKISLLKFNRRMFVSIFLGITSAGVTYFLNNDLKVTLIVLFAVTTFVLIYQVLRERLKISGKIKKMETVFPDFLQLMSSNLRAGITIDRAMLLSARDEFDPLDKEILKTGRDITTGKKIDEALIDMSKRIGSEKISKTVLLILSGLKSGGDVATLLEETAVNMREKAFMEKKASSNVLMYIIFIFLAVSIGAPALFGLSNILVEVLTTLLSDLPAIDANVSTPFTLSSINISLNFVFYFSIVFILILDILASITLGLVSKGSEKEGLKFIIPIIAISFGVFFITKFALSGVVQGFFT